MFIAAGCDFFGNYINPVWHGAKNGGAGASIPQFVLGGAGLVMFGMVLRQGFEFCRAVTTPPTVTTSNCGDQSRRWHDSDALSRFLFKLPAVLQPLLHSGIMLATLRPLC